MAAQQTQHTDTFKYVSIPPYTVVVMEATTIKIHGDTKKQLDLLREYGHESYDDVIRKVIFIAKTSEKEPELSREAITAIEKARERMRKGKFLTEEEAKKRLGL